MSNERSVAHRGDYVATRFKGQEDGLVEWTPATPPDIEAGRTTGRLRSCGYCGSMHPADLAAAIKAGARGHWADFKYGWPHKWYVDDVPNPHTGMLESRMGSSHVTPNCPKTGEACAHGKQSFHHPECECMRDTPELVKTGVYDGQTAMIALPDRFSSSTGKQLYSWHEAGKPAAEKTDGKFYSVHLKDATPEDRAVIERAMGLAFTFEDGKVWWRRPDPVTP